MAPAYFFFGYRLVRSAEGTLVWIQAFVEPHDDKLLTRVRAILPDLVANERTGECRIRCSLTTGEIDVSGSVRTDAARREIRRIAQEGVDDLRMIDELVSEMTKAVREMARDLFPPATPLTERVTVVENILELGPRKYLKDLGELPFGVYVRKEFWAATEVVLMEPIVADPSFPRA